MPSNKLQKKNADLRDDQILMQAGMRNKTTSVCGLMVMQRKTRKSLY